MWESVCEGERVGVPVAWVSESGVGEVRMEGERGWDGAGGGAGCDAGGIGNVAEGVGGVGHVCVCVCVCVGWRLALGWGVCWDRAELLME